MKNFHLARRWLKSVLSEALKISQYPVHLADIAGLSNAALQVKTRILCFHKNVPALCQFWSFKYVKLYK